MNRVPVAELGQFLAATIGRDNPEPLARPLEKSVVQGLVRTMMRGFHRLMIAERGEALTNLCPVGVRYVRSEQQPGLPPGQENRRRQFVVVPPRVIPRK